MPILPDVPRLDLSAMGAATSRHDQLVKPAGGLGRLEDVAVRVAGITGLCPPRPLTKPELLLFAGDHGVVDESVSVWPAEATALMVRNIVAGTAAVSVLARTFNLPVWVVNAGVAGDLSDLSGVIPAEIGAGTADLRSGPAMTVPDAEEAVDLGLEMAHERIDAGVDLIALGDVGVGNRISAGAIVAALTGAEPGSVAGPRSHMEHEITMAREKAITLAVERVASSAHPFDVLVEVGGFEIAALVGAIIGAASRRVPVVLDGAVGDSALLLASRLRPGVEELVIAGHRSTDPIAAVVHSELGRFPLLDLEMHSGEGTGAALAVPMVAAALEVLADAATFRDLGIDAI